MVVLRTDFAADLVQAKLEHMQYGMATELVSTGRMVGSRHLDLVCGGNRYQMLCR